MPINITVTAAKGEIFSFREQKNSGTRMHCSVLMVCLRELVCALIKKTTEFPTVCFGIRDYALPTLNIDPLTAG